MSHHYSKQGITNVMISYHWDSQPLAVKVRDYLRSNGVRVTMNEGEVKGDPFQWMVDSVKASDAIILVLTPKYEQSKNCEREAKFAHDLGKKMIPLVGERNYTGGDGWLATLIAGKLWYDIVNDFDTSMSNILRRELDILIPKRVQPPRKVKQLPLDEPESPKLNHVQVQISSRGSC